MQITNWGGVGTLIAMIIIVGLILGICSEVEKEEASTGKYMAQ